MREAEKCKILYLFKVRRSRVIGALFKSVADASGLKDCGSGWESYEMRVKLDKGKAHSVHPQTGREESQGCRGEAA